MRISESCAKCLYDRQLNKTDNAEYLAAIKELLDNRSEDDTSPYMVYLFNKVHEKYFGKEADYKDIKKKYVIEQLNHWLAFPFWAKSGQFHYKDIPPRIIAEKFMHCEGMDDLVDYKFLCFHGKPYCCTVEVDRYHGHKQLVYDSDWNPQGWRINEFEAYNGSMEKPAQLEAMLALVETLCEGFSHVRVDLYLVDQKIYFGEMTFTPGSGFVSIIPDEYDYILGEQWTIDQNIVH